MEHSSMCTRRRFLSTLSLRRATIIYSIIDKCELFLSTLSLVSQTRWGPGFLSTLSLRRATQHQPGSQSLHPISIHALLAESDAGVATKNAAVQLFLSTLSLRRATLWSTWIASIPRDFYPRSPCGERRRRGNQKRSGAAISIHALLAESDSCGWCGVGMLNVFLSTLSLRRATRLPRSGTVRGMYFYPRSPCGERPSRLHKILADWDFYPRSPCGERQQVTFWQDIDDRISIHALLAESDTPRCRQHLRGRRFLSTLSLRRATCGNAGIGTPISISIHALLAESDQQPAGEKQRT